RPRQWPEKIHVPIEEVDAGPQPGNRDIVVRRDVQAVEPAAAGIENRTLAVGAYLVDENVPVIAGKHEVVSVKTDIRFPFAGNGGILGECVYDGHRIGRDVVLLQLIAAYVVEHIRFRTRPAGLALGMDLERETFQEISRAVI